MHQRMLIPMHAAAIFVVSSASLIIIIIIILFPHMSYHAVT